MLKLQVKLEVTNCDLQFRIEGEWKKLSVFFSSIEHCCAGFNIAECQSMTELLTGKIEDVIYFVRGQKVIFDHDLAVLYGVETRILNQAVKRNLNRFPNDFMFQLSDIERENLRSQFVISSLEYGGRRYSPFVFTELGIAMLSSVLKSEQAIQVNISIMRVFLKVRKLIRENENLADRLEKIEQNSDKLFQLVFERIDELEARPNILSPKRKIGF